MVDLLEKKILSKQAVVGVIGMGYIGLSLLDAFGQSGYSLVGYDKDKERVEMLKRKESYYNFLELNTLFALLDKKRFIPSADPEVLKKADVIVISVPTSLDQYRIPDLSNLRSAFHILLPFLKANQLIVIQSSTYPGTTEEELVPLIAKSKLKIGKDLFVAHVPEVADPGNHEFAFIQIPRIVSGVTPACRKMAELLYRQVGCKVVPVSSTRVAESAKLLQNAFRLVNISLVNEMKVMFDQMGIDVWEVISAAASKPFGFVPFSPGPGIGGDCIPITPFYLAWKAKVTGGPTTLVDQAGRVNDGMPIFVFNKIVLGLNRQKKTIHEAKILVLGVGYKKDVNDIRESPALKILSLLKKMMAEIYYHDPLVAEICGLPDYPHLHMKSVNLDYENLGLYDAVVIVTDHSCYNWPKIVEHSKLVIDTHNVTKSIKGVKKKVIKA